MRTPSNGGYGIILAISCSQERLPVTGLGCNQLSSWLSKGSHENLQITQVVAKTKSCFWQTDSRVPLPMTIFTQFTEHEEVELVPTWSFHATFYSSWWGKVLCRLLKEKCWHQPGHNILDQQFVLSLKYVGQWWHNTHGNSQTMSDLTQDLLYEKKHKPHTAWVTKNQRLDGPETWDKTNTTSPKFNKIMPNDIMLYT